jgi:hypothetical protein
MAKKREDIMGPKGSDKSSIAMSRPVNGVDFVNQLLDMVERLECASMSGDAEWYAALARESSVAKDLHSTLIAHPRLIELLNLCFFPLDIRAFIEDGSLHLVFDRDGFQR